MNQRALGVTIFCLLFGCAPGSSSPPLGNDTDGADDTGQPVDTSSPVDGVTQDMEADVLGGETVDDTAPLGDTSDVALDDVAGPDDASDVALDDVAGPDDASDVALDDVAGPDDTGDVDVVEPPSEGKPLEVLKAAVHFYGAQRCGDAGNWLLVDAPISNHCHLEDGPDLAPDLDLTGGWHDAGDYIKFTLTTAWTAYVLLKAYDTFPDAFPDTDDGAYTGTPNGVPDVLDEVRVATDYLMKTHPDANTLVARVGGDQDHKLWVTSPYQSTLPVADGGGIRPVTSNAKADVAGIVAAALALMKSAYAPYDAPYAQTCLEVAESVYAYGQANPGTTPDNFYADDSYKDGMMCAAVELYRVTQDPEQLAAAIALHEELGPHYWVVDWASQHDYCRHSLYVAGYEEVLDIWGTDVASYPLTVTDNEYVKGLAHFLDWGSLRYATGAAFSAALYADATDDDALRKFALSQLHYVMGHNEYGRSFVVGWGEDSPKNPHHANAYGYDALDWDLSKEPLHTLTGALVGGPMKAETQGFGPGYVDTIDDYIANEVTLDYNSGLVGLAAFAVSCNCFEEYVKGVTGDPDPDPDPDPEDLPGCAPGEALKPPVGQEVALLVDPPSHCHSQFWVGGCEEGNPDSECGGVCAVTNACSPPESPDKADLEMTYMCPRMMAFGPEMNQAVVEDAKAQAWATPNDPPFVYGVVGHDPDPVLDGGVESTCCQCYQLVFEKPEPGSPQPPDLPIPKPMIVQSFDTAAGGGKNFDIYVAAGGFGAFNTCYDAPGYPGNSVFGQFMYTSYPTAVSDEGNVSFIDVDECQDDWSVTAASLQSAPCQERLTELCCEATSPNAWTTYSTRLSCLETNQLPSLYHQNWEVRVKKVSCPEHLTRVTGCRLKDSDMPPPDPTVQSVDDIGADDTSWLAGYTSTTTQDCCKPSCAWQDLVAGKGLDVAQPWNAIYSCDQGGDPITGLGGAGGVCPPGFDGPDCDNNIDDCAQEACQNGGTCVDAINGYTCECPPDWGGADCAMPCPGGECTGLTLQLIEDSVWDEGFTAYLRLTNQGPDTLDGWTVTCQFDFEVTGAWNALWTTDGENHTFTHEEWNAVLLPDNTLDIGMDCMGSLGLDSVLGCTLNGEAMVVPVIKNPG